MLEYHNGKIKDNWKEYNCSDETDMKILCDDINNSRINLDYEIKRMRNKLDSIWRVVEDR